MNDVIYTVGDLKSHIYEIKYETYLKKSLNKILQIE